MELYYSIKQVLHLWPSLEIKEFYKGVNFVLEAYDLISDWYFHTHYDYKVKKKNLYDLVKNGWVYQLTLKDNITINILDYKKIYYVYQDFESFSNDKYIYRFEDLTEEEMLLMEKEADYWISEKSYLHQEKSERYLNYEKLKMLSK